MWRECPGPRRAEETERVVLAYIIKYHRPDMRASISPCKIKVSINLGGFRRDIEMHRRMAWHRVVLTWRRFNGVINEGAELSVAAFAQ